MSESTPDPLDPATPVDSLPADDAAATEPEAGEITKRRVEMTNPPVLLGHDENSKPIWGEGASAIDYVRPDFLDVYVEDAKTRWASVVVSDEPDAGPGGYHGATYVPEHLDHRLAGEFFPATPGSAVAAALAANATEVAAPEVTEAPVDAPDLTQES